MITNSIIGRIEKFINFIKYYMIVVYDEITSDLPFTCIPWTERSSRTVSTVYFMSITQIRYQNNVYTDTS